MSAIDSLLDDIPIPRMIKVLQTFDRPRVVDPRTNEVYVLVSEADFESVQDLLEEERRLRTIHAIGRRNAAGRMEDEA